MYLYQRKSAYKGLILPICIFCAMLILFWWGFGNTADTNGTRDLQAMRSAVQKAIVNCYASEGIYPPNIEYLEDHYGIVINHNKYIIHYERAGSNIMPSVEVFQKGRE